MPPQKTETMLDYYACVSVHCIVIWVQTHLSIQILIQYLGTFFLHIQVLHDAEVVDIREKQSTYAVKNATCVI